MEIFEQYLRKVLLRVAELVWNLNKYLLPRRAQTSYQMIQGDLDR